MSSEALELALALYRAPAQRFALRDRALPADIGGVIRLASGNPELLRQAAGVLCEPESVVLEAVRFYLQQVLFDPDADAYRVLGLEKNAPHERIREHYLWLQRWVHPDRRGNDWVALYSTRVNGAWNQLRNQTAREDYDRAQPSAEPQTHVLKQHDVHQPVGGVWMPIPVTVPGRKWPRFAVLAVTLTTCAVLLLAVLLREDAAPRDWENADRLGVAASESSSSGKTPDQSIRNSSTGVSVSSVYAGVMSASTESQMSPGFTRSPPPGPAAIPLPHAEISSPPLSAQPNAASRAAAAMSVTSADLNGQNHFPAPGRVSATRVLADVDRQNHPRGESPSAARLRPTRRGVPISVETNPVSASPTPRTVAEHSNFGRPPESSRLPESSVATLPSVPEIVAINQSATSDHAASPSVVDGMTKLLPMDMVARIDLARQRVRQVTGYFGGRQANLPDSWLDMPGHLNVERLKGELYARNQLRDTAAFALESPNWYLSHDHAGLSATYHVRLARNTSAESGRFFVDMTWIGDSWHVTRVALEPYL